MPGVETPTTTYMFNAFDPNILVMHPNLHIDVMSDSDRLDFQADRYSNRQTERR